jgi:hypothetical protein
MEATFHLILQEMIQSEMISPDPVIEETLPHLCKLSFLAEQSCKTKSYSKHCLIDIHQTQ